MVRMFGNSLCGCKGLRIGFNKPKASGVQAQGLRFKVPSLGGAGVGSIIMGSPATPSIRANGLIKGKLREGVSLGWGSRGTHKEIQKNFGAGRGVWRKLGVLYKWGKIH